VSRLSRANVPDADLANRAVLAKRYLPRKYPEVSEFLAISSCGSSPVLTFVGIKLVAAALESSV